MFKKCARCIAYPVCDSSYSLAACKHVQKLAVEKITASNKQSAAITELREAFAEWNETPVEMPSNRLLSAINAVIA